MPIVLNADFHLLVVLSDTKDHTAKRRNRIKPIPIIAPTTEKISLCLRHKSRLK